MVGRRVDEVGGADCSLPAQRWRYEATCISRDGQRLEHTQLIIDAIPGNGGMFSLERPNGLRFLTRSRLHSDAEWAALPPL